jgi:tetratricopeptide (TPR) repeat protein
VNLIDLASARPAEVRAMTLDPAGTAESRVEMLRARAMADKELGDLGRGLAGLDDARQISAGNVRLSALVAVTRVGLLAARGDVTEALRLAERAEPYVWGDDLERLRANRDCALACRGVLTELPSAARATSADPAVRAGRLIGAGLSHGYAGRFDDAESALQAAVALGQRHELQQIVLMALNNLGFVAARRGRLPRALALFGEVEPEVSGERLAECRLDRAEALIAAGLAGEARTLLELMMSEAVRAGLTAVAANGL